MSEIRPLRFRMVVEKYRSIRADVASAGLQIQVLMRHEHVTNDELAEAHVVYKRIWLQYMTLRTILRAKYPAADGLARFPWHEED